MAAALGEQFWQHAAGATALRVLLAAAGLDAYLESRIEVGTPVTAAIRYREGAQLAALGLSPYAGAAFHGPPLLLAGAQLLDSLLAPAFPGFSVLAPPWRVLAASAVDVAAAAALARLATAVQPSKGSRTGLELAPAAVAGLYLWSPLSVAVAVGGSPAGLENAAVFAALAAAAAGNAVMAGMALAAAAYIGLHPLLLVVAIALLLFRGPEPLGAVPLAPPPPPLQPPLNGPAATAASAAVTAPGQQPAAAPAEHSRCGADTTAVPEASVPSVGAPAESGPQQEAVKSAAAQPDAAEQQEAARQQEAAAQRFRRDFRRRRRRGGTAAVLVFLVSLTAGGCALAVLSDVALRRFPEHRCGGSLRWLGGERCTEAAASAARPGRGRHWAAETYGFMLTVADLTPNIGLQWYFFQEMFAHFCPFWHFVFHASAAAMVVPVALRMPHRPLAVATLQCITSAMLKPYPSVGDVAQYLALLPLLAPQLRGGGLPVKFLAASFTLLAGLGPAMWHMWIYLGSANANFFYAITLLFGAWQAFLAVAVLTATLRYDRLLACKSLQRW